MCKNVQDVKKNVTSPASLPKREWAWPHVVYAIFALLVWACAERNKQQSAVSVLISLISDTWLQATTISNWFLDGDEMHWACAALVPGRPNIAVLLGMAQYKWITENFSCQVKPDFLTFCKRFLDYGLINYLNCVEIKQYESGMRKNAYISPTTKTRPVIITIRFYMHIARVYVRIWSSY